MIPKTPFDESPIEISPIDFELQVKKLFEQFDKTIKNFEIAHDDKLLTYDGEYQIDIVITFDFLGADFKVLVECKRYNSAIKRETVQILRDKTQILGAHKGILVSASGFQKGAIDYARNHGIALVRIINGEMSYETKSFDKSEIKIPDWIDLPDYIFLWIQGVDDKSIVVTSFNSDYINEFESKILNDNKSPL